MNSNILEPSVFITLLADQSATLKPILLPETQQKAKMFN